MHLIVGLGNPENEFLQTRHNVGFLILDDLAFSAGVSFRPGKGEYWLTQYSLNNKDITLLKPTTHMNNSGIAVAEFLEQQDMPLENILIVCDDFRLPLGTIRLRPSGTDGGHNGLSSVIYHLQTDQFARLRCGIASAGIATDKSKMRDFVLDKFSDFELLLVKPMVERARDACISYTVEGIDCAMNRFNAKPLEDIT